MISYSLTHLLHVFGLVLIAAGLGLQAIVVALSAVVVGIVLSALL